MRYGVPATAWNSPMHGQRPTWQPATPRYTVAGVLISWFSATISLIVAAQLLPGATVNDFWGSALAVAAIAVLNAAISPLVAALRLPFTLALGFLLILVVDALCLVAVSHWGND